MSGSSGVSVHGACSDDDLLISLCWWWLACALPGTIRNSDSLGLLSDAASSWWTEGHKFRLMLQQCDDQEAGGHPAASAASSPLKEVWMKRSPVEWVKQTSDLHLCRRT